MLSTNTNRRAGDAAARQELQARQCHASNSQNPNQSQVLRAALALHYGQSATPLLHVVPNVRYPSMWRIWHPDGALSDMTNLSRARDAARAIAERGPPARNRRRLHWKQERSKTGVAAPLVSQIEGVLA
jgi:hypothetical protein